MEVAGKYKEQLDRVHRWYDRFKEISEGRIHDKPTEFYQDEVYAFFLNCYHLRDWIEKDPTAASVAGKVKGFIDATQALSICADICNSIKHLRLDRRSHSGQDPHFGPREFKLNIGNGPTTVAISYSIDTASGPIDAFKLASECVEAWDGFLSSIS